MLSFFRSAAWKTLCAFLPTFSLIFFIPTSSSAEENHSRQSTRKDSFGIFISEISLTGKDLQKAIHRAMKRWKTVESSDTQSAAAELLALYQALEKDSSFTPSAKENLLRNIRRKLDQISVLILKEITPESQKPQSVNQLKKTELGQVPNALMPDPGSKSNTARNQKVQESGENLVNIIQETIHPDTWETNGGNGQIQFWLPNGTLIIRQTDPVHQEIQGLLNQLRRAGS